MNPIGKTFHRIIKKILWETRENNYVKELPKHYYVIALQKVIIALAPSLSPLLFSNYPYFSSVDNKCHPLATFSQPPLCFIPLISISYKLTKDPFATLLSYPLL